ncbi:MAG: carboxypeptidase-like regulatory domain-containing protein [Gemmatimonas sp.]
MFPRLTVVLWLCVSGVDSLAQSATFAGVARTEGSDTPVPFALVRLVSADSAASRSAPAQGITNAAGRFLFSEVAPGNYRIELLRIGFRPVLSSPVEVANGKSVEFVFRVAAEPLVLPLVTVTAERCVTAGALSKYSQLETLWQQARDGGSVRAGLMARFRYRSVVREVGFELTADGPTPSSALDRPLVNDPKLALKNASRIRAQRLSRGYYGPNDGWGLPNELDVLNQDFLSKHCLEPTIKHDSGVLGIGFQPERTRRDFLDIRGTIWLDSVTYLARRIDLEYVDGDASRGTVRLDFGDVAVAGGALRMPVGGAYSMRPSRKNPAKRTEGTLTFTYDGFEEAPPNFWRL